MALVRFDRLIELIKNNPHVVYKDESIPPEKQLIIEFEEEEDDDQFWEGNIYNAGYWQFDTLNYTVELLLGSDLGIDKIEIE